MKKWIIGIAIVVILGAAVFFVPRFAVQKMVSAIPSTPSAEYVTDFTLADEKTFTIEKDEFSVKLPTYYTEQTDQANLSAIACSAPAENKKILLFYRPVLSVIDKFDSNSSQQYFTAMEESTQAFQTLLGALGYEQPDSYFEVLKLIALADESDYNFWKLKDTTVTAYYLALRNETDIDFVYFYERDNIMAYVYKDGEGVYGVDLVNKFYSEDIYGFVLNTDDPEDAIRILNSFEFNF